MVVGAAATGSLTRIVCVPNLGDSTRTARTSVAENAAMTATPSCPVSAPNRSASSPGYGQPPERVHHDPGPRLRPSIRPDDTKDRRGRRLDRQADWRRRCRNRPREPLDCGAPPGSTAQSTTGNGSWLRTTSGGRSIRKRPPSSARNCASTADRPGITLRGFDIQRAPPIKGRSSNCPMPLDKRTSAPAGRSTGRVNHHTNKRLGRQRRPRRISLGQREKNKRKKMHDHTSRTCEIRCKSRPWTIVVDDVTVTGRTTSSHTVEPARPRKKVARPEIGRDRQGSAPIKQRPSDGL